MAESKNKKIQSRARRIKILLKKYNKMWNAYDTMENFEEPVLFLMRNNRKVEFHEKATEGKFIFTHTDGKERSIELSPQYLHTFDYGKRTFKGYICHEDYPTPLPDNPIVTAEMFGIAIDKTLNDMKKWKADELRATGDMWWKIFAGIAIVVLVFGVVKLLIPNFSLNPFGGGAKEVAQVAQNVTQNASIIARNITAFP